MPSTWPEGLHLLERGWLSSNNVLLTGKYGNALVDSGYWTQADQTVGLVAHLLEGRPLDLLVNTHLHSDHCGGNAELSKAYSHLDLRIPAGDAIKVRDWDVDALSFKATGQGCPRFVHRSTFCAGDSLELGSNTWQVHRAPGHEANALLLFEPVSRTLISGDALWEAGFGVVFPELEGEPGFADVARTLTLIEELDPRNIIPGHGPSFANVERSLAYARKKVAFYEANPIEHAKHAMKVLLKFKLMEVGSMPRLDFLKWCSGVPLINEICTRYFPGHSVVDTANECLLYLTGKGHVAPINDAIVNQVASP